MVIETRRVRFEKYDLPVKNLPAEWEGEKLIQISDIHLSKYVDRNYLNRIVKRVNQEKPDVIVLTGDYLSGDDKYLHPLTEELSQLKTNLGDSGKIAIYGNHDCGNLGSPIVNGVCRVTDSQKRVGKALENSGFTVLLNDSMEIGEKERLTVIGLGDLWAGQTNLKKALRGLDLSKKGAIILMHNPDYFPKMAGKGAFTVLAGHTHGGQVMFYGKRKIFRKKWNYVKGFYREQNSIMYVNRGVGVSILPIRLNSPPEVTIFTLRRK